MLTFHVIDKCICCSGESTEKKYRLAPFIAHRLMGEPCENRYIPCKTRICKVCGTAFLDIRYTDAQLGLIYRNYRDKEYVETRTMYEPGYPAINDWMNAEVPYMAEIESMLKPHLTLPVSILDWGGDDGHNAPFRDVRWRLHVYDIGSKPVIKGAEKVERGDMAHKYDLIVCANVLEHVPEPGELLADIYSVMNMETVLYLELPGDGLPGYGWHEHINLFSQKGIEMLLDRCGLYIESGESLEVKMVDSIIFQNLVVVKRKDAQ
jgi:SAM-dependent methyltransferase